MDMTTTVSALQESGLIVTSKRYTLFAGRGTLSHTLNDRKNDLAAGGALRLQKGCRGWWGHL